MEESTRKQQYVRTSGFPIKSDDSASCVIDGETLIVHDTNKKLFVLNSAGTRIWELADGTHTIKDIEASIKRRSKKSDEQIRKEVDHFIDELVNKRVLVILNRPLNLMR